MYSPLQTKSFFCTSGTLRPLIWAGAMHWVKGAKPRLALSQSESQDRWQSQWRLLECRRLRRRSEGNINFELNPGLRFFFLFLQNFNSEQRLRREPALLHTETYNVISSALISPRSVTIWLRLQRGHTHSEISICSGSQNHRQDKEEPEVWMEKTQRRRQRAEENKKKTYTGCRQKMNDGVKPTNQSS